MTPRQNRGFDVKTRSFTAWSPARIFFDFRGFRYVVVVVVKAP
jgi:hypothetical protein